MARFSGTKGNVKVDTDGGGAAEAMLGIDSWSMDLQADAIETTAFDSAGVKSYIAGGTEWSASFSGKWDTDETDIVGDPPLLAVGTRVEIELYLTDDTSDYWFAGDAIVTKFSPTVKFDGSVEYSIDVKGTESVTYPVTPV